LIAHQADERHITYAVASYGNKKKFTYESCGKKVDVREKLDK